MTVVTACAFGWLVRVVAMIDVSPAIATPTVVINCWAHGVVGLPVLQYNGPEMV